MTIKEVIDAVDTLKPNQYTLRDKVQWLSFIDERIINDVLKTHEGYDEAYDEFNGYSEGDLTVSLIVESPYDRLYPAFVSMKIDECNGDTQKYNNSYIIYNNYLLEYRKYYNKTHMPLPVGIKRASCPVKPIDKLSDAEIEAIKRDLYFQLSQEGVGDLVTFGDLTPEQIEMLRGEKGEDGKDGKDGKDGVTPDLSNYVQKTDVVTKLGDEGLVKLYTDTTYGIGIKNGCLAVTGATENLIKGKGSSNAPITPKMLDYAIIRGLAYNESAMTDTEKASALTWLGAPRISFGTYIGTGTYGSANPTKVPCSFKPDVILVFGEGSMITMSSYSTLAVYSGGANGNAKVAMSINFAYTDGFMSWYSENTTAQANNNGKEYTWVAIGGIKHENN